MGAIAGNAYGLGVAIGLAQYFTSRGDTATNLMNANQTVGYARNFANALDQEGIVVGEAPLAGISTSEPGNSVGPEVAKTMYSQIVNANTMYGQALADHPLSPKYNLSAIYNFGVSIAITEGELSINNDDPTVGDGKQIASTWLQAARNLAAKLQNQYPFLNPAGLPRLDYNSVTTCRQTYQTLFSAADDITGSSSSPLIQAQDGQPDWQWCNKCQALSFGGSPSLGACPAGGDHDHTGSGNYILSQSDSPGSDQQADWRWCNKCQVLTFAGSDTPGRCQAGGSHDNTGSGNYVLSDNVPEGPNEQANWLWCNKCQELTFGGSPTVGPCPAGGNHDHSGSGNYVLAFT